MSWGNRKSERVTFATGFPVHIMGSDGSWRRACTLLDISSSGARLLVDESVAGLSLKEFFLVLSTSGRVFRRCGLIRVNGSEIGIAFAEEATSRSKKKPVLVK
jgi:hypothetical protein